MILSLNWIEFWNQIQGLGISFNLKPKYIIYFKYVMVLRSDIRFHCEGNTSNSYFHIFFGGISFIFWRFETATSLFKKACLHYRFDEVVVNKLVCYVLLCSFKYRNRQMVREETEKRLGIVLLTIVYKRRNSVRTGSIQACITR